MTLTYGGRQVYLCTGTKSQTINICNAKNRRGDYEWIVRLFRPQSVTEDEIADHKDNPESLVQWLVEKGGRVEKRPPPDDLPPDQSPPANGPVPVINDDPWIAVVVSIVENSIDQLVREFLRVPFLHRVEHSLHARLYSILAAQPHFARELPLQDDVFSQPLHKEWPETIPQENTKRGNFDLAVLTPRQLQNCNVDQFWNGELPAPIVIEMGLDYGSRHLARDRYKLIHSQVPHGYLVHFTRINRDPVVENIIEDIIRDPAGNGHVHIAYACVYDNVRRYKLVNDNAIHDAQER